MYKTELVQLLDTAPNSILISKEVKINNNVGRKIILCTSVIMWGRGGQHLFCQLELMTLVLSCPERHLLSAEAKG